MSTAGAGTDATVTWFHVVHEVVAPEMPASSTPGGRALSLGRFAALGGDSAVGEVNAATGPGSPPRPGDEGVPLGCCRLADTWHHARLPRILCSSATVRATAVLT